MGKVAQISPRLWELQIKGSVAGRRNPGCRQRPARPRHPKPQLPGGPGCEQAEQGDLSTATLPSTAQGDSRDSGDSQQLPRAPPNPTSPAPGIARPRSQARREGQQAEGKSLEHPKPSLENRGGFCWKAATGDEQKAVAGMELEAALGCLGDP